MKVHFLVEARDDLDRIRQWIARDDPVRALEFVQALRQRAESLAEHARRFPIVMDDGAFPVRKLTHGRYQIFYRVLEHEVQVLAVRHAARSAFTGD